MLTVNSKTINLLIKHYSKLKKKSYKCQVKRKKRTDKHGKIT